MAVKGIVSLVLAFVVGAVVAAFLAGGRLDDAPSEPVFPTVTATSSARTVATPAEAVTPTDTPVAEGPREPEMSVDQVIGMRGCDQPIFVTASGLEPRTRVRTERVDAPGPAIVLGASAHGFAAVDGRPLFERNCEPGVRYGLRLIEESSGRELATSTFEVPVFRGTIEVEPTSGGCSEIVVTVRGMPAGSLVGVSMAEPLPFTDNYASILWPPLETDNDGFARSAPFRPPWRCDQAAVSLSATVEENHPRPAELLYRIALGPDEPVPSVERWLSSVGR